MPFVRRKGEYHYLVASRREGGKVRQVVVGYLGLYDSLDAALAGLPDDIAAEHESAARCRERAEEERQQIADWLKGAEVPKPGPDDYRRAQWRTARCRNYWWWMRKADCDEQSAADLRRRLDKLQAIAGPDHHVPPGPRRARWWEIRPAWL